MPIEIRELVIRAVALPEREDEELADEDRPQPPLASLRDREAIIQECVRQVLRILRKEKER